MQTNSTPLVLADDRPRTITEFRDLQYASRQPPVAWPTPLSEYVLKLTPTEAATVRIEAKPMGEVVVGRGPLSEVGFRLALWQERGVLPWASAHYVAQHLQLLFGNRHPIAMRKSKSGWKMLASAVELGYADAAVAAEPTPDDPRHFRKMDLTSRLYELAGMS